MTEYTIYCTEEQTKKALELGAKIEESIDYNTDGHLVTMGYMLDGEVNEKNLDGFGWANILRIPTAEQMRGWLEEQGVSIDVTMASKKLGYYSLKIIDDRGITNFIGRSQNDYCSRNEATLAAIDVALDYLIKKQEII